MITLNADSEGRFYRDADRAVLGGVCAGLATHLGLNLKVTRILAFIAFLMAMPFAIIAYLATVLLVPSATSRHYDAAEEKRFGRRRKSRHRARRKAKMDEEQGPSAAEIISRQCQTLDERLVRLEKHVTSKRFQLEQELSRL